MFLDEKLEQIYTNTEKGSVIQSNELIRALTDNLNENFNMRDNTVEDFLRELRRVDNSWHLFAKRHSDIDPLAFRRLVQRFDVDGKFTKALNW